MPRDRLHCKYFNGVSTVKQKVERRASVTCKLATPHSKNGARQVQCRKQIIFSPSILGMSKQASRKRDASAASLEMKQGSKRQAVGRFFA